MTGSVSVMMTGTVFNTVGYYACRGEIIQWTPSKKKSGTFNAFQRVSAVDSIESTTLFFQRSRKILRKHIPGIKNGILT